MSETPKNIYCEQLLDWGRSGSLYPNLIPTDNDCEQLRAIQEDLATQFPHAEPVSELHTTIFHVTPHSLYDYMSANVNPSLREDWLYMDLSNNLATAVRLFRGIEAHVEGIERFDEESSTLALRLDPAPRSKNFIDDLRELVEISITRNGATSEDLAVMQELPEYRWLLGESKPHISLLTGAATEEIPRLALPDMITFNGLGQGSVMASVEDQLRWYILPSI